MKALLTIKPGAQVTNLDTGLLHGWGPELRVKGHVRLDKPARATFIYDDVAWRVLLNDSCLDVQPNPDGCPACGEEDWKAYDSQAKVRLCQKCGCLYGELTYAESLRFVSNQFITPDPPAEQWFNYDFMTERGRRHGIADKVTRRIVQTG